MSNLIIYLTLNIRWNSFLFIIFGIICDKVSNLKTILVFVYTDLYTTVPYLYKFDKYILDSIENNTDNILNRDEITFELEKKKYYINDVKWVLNKKHLSSMAINIINSKNIFI